MAKNDSNCISIHCLFIDWCKKFYFNVQRFGILPLQFIFQRRSWGFRLPKMARTSCSTNVKNILP